MAAKEKHIELSEKELAIIEKSVAKSRELRNQFIVAQELLNDHGNSEQQLIELICENHKIEYVDGIRFDGKKLIVPPKK
jgi:hypothetical protein